METDVRRPSAVMLLLFQRDGEEYVILTRRTDTVADHKGQISFPGGRWEESDPDLLHTALRETWEEIGIAPEKIEVIGQLEQTPTKVTNYVITPFLGRLSEPPTYRADPREVAEIIEAPLSAFTKPERYWEEERNDGIGVRTVDYFQYRDYVVWGATARILKKFVKTL